MKDIILEESCRYVCLQFNLWQIIPFIHDEEVMTTMTFSWRTAILMFVYYGNSLLAYRFVLEQYKHKLAKELVVQNKLKSLHFISMREL